MTSNDDIIHVCIVTVLSHSICPIQKEACPQAVFCQYDQRSGGRLSLAG